MFLEAGAIYELIFQPCIDIFCKEKNIGLISIINLINEEIYEIISNDTFLYTLFSTVKNYDNTIKEYNDDHAQCKQFVELSKELQKIPKFTTQLKQIFEWECDPRRMGKYEYTFILIQLNKNSVLLRIMKKMKNVNMI